MYARLALKAYQFSKNFSGYMSLDFNILCAVYSFAHQWLVVLDILW
jgi:hypothetical protein